jgi:MerR family mercuric resistance operon transcriptional regulator
MVRNQERRRMSGELTIGQLAQTAGVNVETIRYYQRRGLLDEPDKPLGGHRRYSADAVKRVRFIKRAQQLGFTLEEVKSLLLLEEGQNCRETCLLAEQKLEQIEGRISDLSRMRDILKELITQCIEGKRPRSCPIIITLEKDP